MTYQKITGLLVICLGGCAGINAMWVADVRGRAPYDLNCHGESVTVNVIKNYQMYGAHGCGKSATYVVTKGQGVVLENPPQKIETGNTIIVVPPQ